MREMTKEEIIIAGSITLVVIVIGAGAFFLHEASSSIFITNSSPATVTVPFTTLTEGRQSTVDKRVNYVITSSTQLNQLWKVVSAKGEPPTIDFKTHTVIAVFAGAESSSTITIAKIEDAGARMVSVAIARPDCIGKQPPTSPYEIVAVPATSLPLAHEDKIVTVNCQ